MNCNSYDKCINNERCNLRHPVDRRSLYGNRVYDNQTGNKRCYERHPIEIVEGFGCPSRDLIKTILKWTIIGLIIYVISMMVIGMKKEQVTLGIETPVPVTSATLGF